MNLHDFILETMRQVKTGIDEANKTSNYKASYPTEIQFNIGLNQEGNVCKNDERPHHRFKFTMHLSHYSWEK